MTSSPPNPSESPSELAGDSVSGIQKALKLLESFHAGMANLTVSQASRLSGTSRTSARRMLVALTAAGYLVSDGKRYALTARALRIGDAYLDSSKLPKIARPIIERLGYIAQESATMGVLDGTDVIYIVRSSVTGITSPTMRPGSRVPLYCSAGGRMLLASMPAAMAAQLLEASVMRPLTPYTLLHAADILPRLPAIAERGYSVIDREFEVNMRTLSVPVVNAGDEVVGVVSMSVHAEKYSLDALISENLPRLFEAQALLRDLV